MTEPSADPGLRRSAAAHLRQTLRAIIRTPYRSAAVFLCAFLVAGLVLFIGLVLGGARDSLRLATDRLGADILVVPGGTEAEVETTLMMGTANSASMPAQHAQDIRRLPGVAQVSPELYLSSLSNASCCTVPDMLFIAYDPATDFTIQPWLERKLGRQLGMGEAVGGTNVFVPPGEENLRLYGSVLALRANLEPTGTNLDRTLFITFDTASEIARVSRSQAEQPLEVPADRISAALVRLAPDADADAVAMDIERELPDVSAINSLDLFGSFRNQMSDLLRAMVSVLSATFFLSLVLISLVFSIAAHERRRELGVLRALGATRARVLALLLSEAAVLALAGGVCGALVFGILTALFHDLIAGVAGVPFLLPSLPGLLAMAGAGLILGLAGVMVAALVPALRAIRQEPALAMRE